MTVALTGAHGFLGWHTRVLLKSCATPIATIAVGEKFDVAHASTAVSGADRLIHIAGANRGNDVDVLEGNILMAQQMAKAVTQAEKPPSVIVFANSLQAGNGSVYAESKERAAEILAEAAARRGVNFLDLMLPNLFGEGGRPFYNSVTATFCHLLARGEHPTVEHDKELSLMHAQHAAELLTGNLHSDDLLSKCTIISVTDLLTELKEYSAVYAHGDIPGLTTDFRRDLFNTYRSFAFVKNPEIRLTQNTDPRGAFSEIVRSQGGDSQTSFSTTVPGVTRGEHFHRRKVERFAVLAGEAVISLRKLFTDTVTTVKVSGKQPVAIDMPTMWSHNITNVGSAPLYTLFWSNEIFDPTAPDTFPEPV